MNERENNELGVLIGQIAAGDKSAIGEIFTRVGGAMKAVARLYLHSEADADDVVQDSLLAIVRNAGRFRENRNAKAWINTIVVNTAKNKLAAIRRRGECDLSAAEEVPVSFQEDAVLVREIFAHLRPRERKLIIYRYWYRCSIGEIASILHCAKSTVKYRLDNLEEKLKTFYREN